MFTTEKDLIKLGVRTIGQCVRLRDIFRRRCYDTTNSNTHACGSYSYTTTTRPNTASSMQTPGRKKRSFLFSPRSSGNNGHHPDVVHHHHQHQPEKMLRKKSQVLELGQSNSCAYLAEFLIKFRIQRKNKFCNRQSLAWRTLYLVWKILREKSMPN